MFPDNPTLETQWLGQRDLLEQILSFSCGDPIAGRMPSEGDTPVRVSFEGNSDVDLTCLENVEGCIQIRISPAVFVRIQSIALCVVLCDFVRPFPNFFYERGFDRTEAYNLLTRLADSKLSIDQLFEIVGKAFASTTTHEPWTRVSLLGSESNVICQLAFFQLIAIKLHRFYVLEKYHVVDRVSGEIVDGVELETAIYAQCAQAAGATLADRVDADLNWYAIDPRVARYGRRVERMAHYCGLASTIACDIDAMPVGHDASQLTFINDGILPRTFRDELATRRGPAIADKAFIAFYTGKQVYQEIRRQSLPDVLDEASVRTLYNNLFTLSAKLAEETRIRQGVCAVEERFSDIKSAAGNFDPDVIDRIFKPRGPFDKYEK